MSDEDPDDEYGYMDRVEGISKGIYHTQYVYNVLIHTSYFFTALIIISCLFLFT